MFTGLVQQVGEYLGAETRGSGVEARIAAPAWAGALVLGESIAVDGCCLTVESTDGGVFSVFASPETMAKTSLGDRKAGDGVNLERALAVGDRLGGHMVSGHVDGTGRIRSVRELADSWEVRVEGPPELLRQCIPKGSIAVDGISLTIVDLAADDFSLWIIPETWRRTTLSARPAGSRVNLETDLVGKYVFRFLETGGGGASSRLESVWRAYRTGTEPGAPSPSGA